ncbi:MAG TPA: FAD-binding oxidoreductase [Polyangiales bacterium]|nr:FAD-binding oxidoreductase [Polyangiales bacterium]
MRNTPPMDDLISALSRIVGENHVLSGHAIAPEYTHDEALTVAAVTPRAVVRPGSTADVSAILALCSERRVPVVARGGGTGLSGACTPKPESIVLSLERMRRIVEIDEENQVAVCEPFVRLAELYAAAEEKHLMYPIVPGENSATVGGNVGTNAGGMQAVKYGVTRHQVLGITAVLASGEVIRSGGKFVKVSSGYDLTQLIIGSEGTLAIVTQVILKLVPRLPYRSTILAPFSTLEEVTRAVPKLLALGRQPLMLEYIDMLTMASILQRGAMDLGIPQTIRDRALAYLVIVTEGRDEERTALDAQDLGAHCQELGALDVYMLPSQAGRKLIEAREQSFWAAKAAGAGDVIDVVVPRAQISAFVGRASQIAQRHAAFVVGCGHAGDGNVHFAIFHGEPDVRKSVTRELLSTGIELGGAISGEHGIGLAKKAHYMEFEDPVRLALQRRIKQAFDPLDILNPGTIFD